MKNYVKLIWSPGSTLLVAGCMLLLIGPSLCQEGSDANATQAASVPEVDNSAGEANLTQESSSGSESVNVLVVVSSTGEPCLLAALNATIQISYKVLEGIVHERYVSTADIQLPEDVNARGVCGNDTSMLILDWGNGTFHLNLTFSLYEPESLTENSTWSMSDISVAYDLANSYVFPGASEASLVTAERTDLNLFPTELGHTFSCQRDTTVQVGTEDQGVNVKFHNVLLAAFGVMSSDFPAEVDHCPIEDDSSDSEDLLVPLIVACCLAALVVIIVIGYVINRNVQRGKEQREYRSM